jgi:hypothetical protein
MSDRVPGQPEANVPFAPKPKARPEGNFVAEDSGHAIIALLKKAADMAKEDCARVMDVAHPADCQAFGPAGAMASHGSFEIYQRAVRSNRKRLRKRRWR